MPELFKRPKKTEPLPPELRGLDKTTVELPKFVLKLARMAAAEQGVGLREILSWSLVSYLVSCISAGEDEGKTYELSEAAERLFRAAGSTPKELDPYALETIKPWSMYVPKENK